MKKLLVGLFLISSFSTFAGTISYFDNGSKEIDIEATEITPEGVQLIAKGEFQAQLIKNASGGLITHSDLKHYNLDALTFSQKIIEEGIGLQVEANSTRDSNGNRVFKVTSMFISHHARN